MVGALLLSPDGTGEISPQRYMNRPSHNNYDPKMTVISYIPTLGGPLSPIGWGREGGMAQLRCVLAGGGVVGAQMCIGIRRAKTISIKALLHHRSNWGGPYMDGSCGGWCFMMVLGWWGRSFCHRMARRDICNIPLKMVALADLCHPEPKKMI